MSARAGDAAVRLAFARSPPSPTRGEEKRSGNAALETFGDLLARQIAADEDDAAFALLVLLPGRW